MFLFSQLTSWLQSNVQNHLFGEKYAVVGAEDKFLLLHHVSFKTRGTYTQGGLNKLPIRSCGTVPYRRDKWSTWQLNWLLLQIEVWQQNPI